MRRSFLFLAIVTSPALLIGALVFTRDAAVAHGGLDQALQFNPACLESTLKASASSASAPRQEVVPAAASMQALDVCVTTAGAANINVAVRGGTAAAPGAVLTSASTPVGSAGTQWVHIELPTPLATTPGTKIVLELTGVPAVAWRGTCGPAVPPGCAAADPDLYTQGVSNAAPNVGDLAFRTYAADDMDADGAPDFIDNCPDTPNPTQLNSDADFIELGAYGKPYDDVTWPYSDVPGDACDLEDDNDGLSDTVEQGLPSAACASASAPTDPVIRDSDGDRALDGAECAFGTDPANALSKPPIPAPSDPDGDGLPTSLENTIGSNPNTSDTDGDKLIDGVEFKYYNSSPLFTDGDIDGCADSREVASINGDRNVNVLDLHQVAGSLGPSTSPGYIVHFDVNKDGSINVIDLSFVASLLGSC